MPDTHSIEPLSFSFGPRWDGKVETLTLWPNGVWLLESCVYLTDRDEIVELPTRPVSVAEAMAWLTDHVPAALQDPRVVSPVPDRTGAALERVASAMAGDPGDLVGTDYVAKKLDCSTQWVTTMLRKDVTLRRCAVPGTGNGHPWKLYRGKVDEWIRNRGKAAGCINNC